MLRRLGTLTICFVLCVIGTASAADAPAKGPALELTLTAKRSKYVFDAKDPTRDPKHGRTAEVVLVAELRNNGKDALQIVTTPDPEWQVTGPKPESVRVAGGLHFYVDQVATFTLGAGEVRRIVVQRLSYRVDTSQFGVAWIEPGEYAVRGVWNLAITPAPEGSDKPDANIRWQAALTSKNQPLYGIVRATSPAVKLTVKAGDEVAYWAEALADKDEAVRLCAVQALKDRGVRAVAGSDALIRALRDPNQTIRQTAAETLGLFAEKGKSAAPALKGALADSAAEVRAAAAVSLASVDRDSNVGLEALLPLLTDKSAAVRVAAINAIAHMNFNLYKSNPAVVPALRAMLKDPDEAVCNTAIQAVARLEDPVTVLDLLRFLRPEDVRFRGAALHALGSMGRLAKPALPAMIEILKKDPENREMTAWAVAHLGPDGGPAVPALIDCLDDKNPQVRNQAARTLRDIGPNAEEATGGLARLLVQDTDWGVRNYSAEALGAIGPRAKEAVPQLAAALTDKMCQVRDRAAEALGKIGPGARAALPNLLATMREDPESQTRWLAVHSITQIGIRDKKAVPTLIDALSDPSESVVFHSVVALGQIGPDAKDAVKSLEGLLTHKAAYIREAAAGALKKIQGK